MQTLRQLVCGTDFSACAEHALALAIRLAAATGARVTLVHVCEPGPDELDDRQLLRCAEALSAIVTRQRNSGVEVTGVQRSGTAWKKLDNVAAEVGANLIVVGRQGDGRNVEIGSVAEQLVRRANRPVLTVACDFTCLVSEANATDHT